MVVNAYGYIILILWITMAQPGGQEKTTALKDLLSRIDLDELMKKDEPPLYFPRTLEEFEYAFNDQGQLRHIKTGEPFVFNYREDLHRWNQKILFQNTLPCITSFIYLSKDALNNPDKLLVLIQGRGVVRAGQWARRLIINEDIDSGSQIPFISRAAEKNSTPEEHVLYVWDNFISKSAAKNVFFIAHSYGGLSFVELMIKREAQVKSRVQAVAMTDSVHNVWHQEAGKSTLEWMQEHCCNWVSSTEPLDTPLETMLPDCPRISAGTERHELTSWRSFHSIFKFFTATLEAQNSDTKPSTSVTTRSSNRNKHEEF
uniref:ARB2 cotranscriptional regulator A n=1 Tax=Paramormyrops kingsleyae TaxID=1676925 RepID=A0A3B3SNT4_9TELE